MIKNPGVDPFIGMYFDNFVETFGEDDEEVIITLGAAAEDSLADFPGLDIKARSGETVVAKIDSGRIEALLKHAEVKAVVSLRGQDYVPVLVRLRSGMEWTKNIPGFTPGSQLGRVLTGRADRTAIERLVADPDVLSVEASRQGGGADCDRSIPFVRADVVQRPPLQEQGQNALIAIIDTGIDVLHAAFQAADRKKTRLVAIWDQLDGTGPSPKKASAAGLTGGIVYGEDYGTYHSAAQIDGYISAQVVPAGLGRDSDMFSERHGTHVASIAAGSPFKCRGGPYNGTDFPGGVAPQAGILLVICASEHATRDPESLGYSVPHVDALAFIKAAAKGLGKPVVVNASFGMNAGAHDGTSLLELAFDEFTGGGREPGFVVVKSAGNEQQFDGHAEATVTQGAIANIGWHTTADPRRQDYLEFWFASSDELEFTLTPPGGAAPVKVTRAAPDAKGLLPGGQGFAIMSMKRFHHDNGDTRLTVWVQKSNSYIATAGNWDLAIKGVSIKSTGTVHGWVEKSGARALKFTTGATPARLLSIPGTARTVIAVGACDRSQPPRPAPFSSRGPSRDERRKPELCAPGHGILAAEAGTHEGLRPDSGTSMAAPHVSGAVALLLSHHHNSSGGQLNAAQIRSALSQCLGGYSGTWDPGSGYGWLDAPSLFEAFA